jgi:Fe-S-cluster containining protein
MSDHLCVHCAMCCDRTLFGYVQVTKEEVTALGGGGEFEMVDGRLSMRQRCVRLGNDGMCGVYENRPAKCRAFRCDLLRDFETGKVCDEVAKQIVDEAHAMRDRCEAHMLKHVPKDYMPEREPSPRRLMHALNMAHKDGVELDQRAYELAVFMYMMLTMFLKENFYDHEDFK